jgi:hypothetical protein
VGRSGFNPLLGIAHSHLVALVEEALPVLEKRATQTRIGRFRDYYFSAEFIRRAHKYARKPGYNPPFSVEITGDSLNMSADLRFYRPLEERLDALTQFSSVQFTVFANSFRSDFEWMRARQEELARYTVAHQETYVRTLNAFDLQPLRQEDLAEQFSLDESTVCRLVDHMRVQLPLHKQLKATLPLMHLIPSRQLQLRQALQALHELSHDPAYGWGGMLTVHSSVIGKELQDSYNISAQGRTVRKYVSLYKERDHTLPLF